MPDLNTPQQRAVTHLGSPLLVLAGAGSGKTRVITSKIAWLIKERAVNPADITAVTFTNKAAREMKQRVLQMFGESDSLKGLTVSTFHSLGMQIVRRQAKELGLKPGFSIIDPRDVSTVISELLRADLTQNKDLVERVARRISHWKNIGMTPEQASLDPIDPITIAASTIYPNYQRYLCACNSIDLDDLIYLPIRVFFEHEEVLRHWQLRVRHLLVDEYQDTNGVQYQLVRMLARDGNRLTVVGDDDQSIYAWRGAQPQNLALLNNDFPNLAVIKLEQNYRSCARILNVANSLIQHNQRSFKKSLWSSLGQGDPVRIFSADNEQIEAERTVSAIMRHQFRHQSKHGDFAILYRSNHQARGLEIRLREMRIPYRISGGSSFFDRSEIRDLMAYLRLLTNPSDDSAFLRIVNTPRRGVGATSLEKLAATAKQKNQSLFTTLLDPQLQRILKTTQANTLLLFAQKMTEFADSLQTSDPTDTIREMLDYLRYESWLKQTCDLEVATKRWQNIELMLQWLESTNRFAETERTLAELIGEMILNDKLDQEQEQENTNQVNLMTLHAAKGLEFPHVFIVGVEEGILPHRVSVDEGSDQEERRLFYVGITRAMHSLTLSYAEKRTRFGKKIECEPSRFLRELPVGEIEWDKGQTGDPAHLQDTGRAHIASIRALRQTKKSSVGEL